MPDSISSIEVDRMLSISGFEIMGRYSIRLLSRAGTIWQISFVSLMNAASSFAYKKVCKRPWIIGRKSFRRLASPIVLTDLNMFLMICR